VYADDGAFDLAQSRSGAIQMDSAPMNASAPPATLTTLVSMFQTDSTAFLASRWLNLRAAAGRRGRLHGGQLLAMKAPSWKGSPK
jgi:hypothetical protein